MFTQPYLYMVLLSPSPCVMGSRWWVLLFCICRQLLYAPVVEVAANKKNKKNILFFRRQTDYSSVFFFGVFLVRRYIRISGFHVFFPDLRLRPS